MSESRALWVLVFASIAIPMAAGFLAMFMAGGDEVTFYVVTGILVLPVFFRGSAVLDARFPADTTLPDARPGGDIPWLLLAMLSALVVLAIIASLSSFDGPLARWSLGVLTAASIVVVLAGRQRAKRV